MAPPLRPVATAGSLSTPRTYLATKIRTNSACNNAGRRRRRCHLHRHGGLAAVPHLFDVHSTQTRDCWCCGRRLMPRRSASGKTPRSPSQDAAQNAVQASKAPRLSCLTEKDGVTCLVCAKPRNKTVCKQRGQLERAAASAKYQAMEWQYVNCTSTAAYSIARIGRTSKAYAKGGENNSVKRTTLPRLLNFNDDGERTRLSWLVTLSACC